MSLESETKQWIEDMRVVHDVLYYVRVSEPHPDEKIIPEGSLPFYRRLRRAMLKARLDELRGLPNTIGRKIVMNNYGSIDDRREELKLQIKELEEHVRD